MKTLVMNTIIIFLLSFLVGINLHAQNTLSGTVYLYKEKGNNTPVEGVNVKASGSSQLTKKNGAYFFAFDNQVSAVGLQAMKKGYEVINDEDIRTFQLDKKKLQHIYLDIEGNTRKRERELLDAALSQRLKLRDKYYDILENGGKEAEQLKIKLEKESSKSFANVDELKGYIYDKYGADSKTLESIIPSIIRLNLDHLNKDVEKMKKYALNGMVDSVVFLLNLGSNFIDAVANNKTIEAAFEKNRRIKELTITAIPTLISNGLTWNVDSCYQLITLIDTSDIMAYIDYASFLVKNRSWKADSLIDICLKKSPSIDDASKAAFLFLKGEVTLENLNYQDAVGYYENALKIQKKLFKVDSAKYEYPIALTLLGLGKSRYGYQGSKAGLHESIRILKRHSNEVSNKYDKDLSEAYGALGYVYRLQGDFAAEVLYLNEQIELLNRLIEKDFAPNYWKLKYPLEDLVRALSKLEDWEAAKEANKRLLDYLIFLNQSNLGWEKDKLYPYAYEITNTASTSSYLFMQTFEKDSALHYYKIAFNCLDSLFKIKERYIKKGEGSQKVLDGEVLRFNNKIVPLAISANDINAALRYSERAFCADSSILSVRIYRAHVLLLTGNLDEAIKIYLSALTHPTAIEMQKRDRNDVQKGIVEDLTDFEFLGIVSEERRSDVLIVKEMFSKSD